MMNSRTVKMAIAILSITMFFSGQVLSKFRIDQPRISGDKEKHSKDVEDEGKERDAKSKTEKKDESDAKEYSEKSKSDYKSTGKDKAMSNPGLTNKLKSASTPSIRNGGEKAFDKAKGLQSQ